MNLTIVLIIVLLLFLIKPLILLFYIISPKNLATNSKITAGRLSRVLFSKYNLSPLYFTVFLVSLNKDINENPSKNYFVLARLPENFFGLNTFEKRKIVFIELVLGSALQLLVISILLFYIK